MTPQELEANLERLHVESFGWALACCRWDRAEADDVLQATYLKVLDGRARFAGRSSFRTWLFGVIRFTAAESRRRTWLQLKRVERWFRHDAGLAAPETDPLRELAQNEQANRLVEGLLELPKRQREVLHLVFYEGMTIQGAADLLRLSIGSARTHYERGKRRLRVVLAGEKNEWTQ